MLEPGGQVASIGWRVEVSRPRSGSVHSVFPRAVNCLVDGQLLVILDAAAPDAPFGLRLDGKTRPGDLGAGPGDPVRARAGYLAVGPAVLDCRSAFRWIPGPLGPLGPGWPERLGQVHRQAAPRAWTGSAHLAAGLVGALLARPDSQTLQSAVDRVVGRGPGLTPAGDDVLVGLLAGLWLAGIGGDHRAREDTGMLHSRLAQAWRATPSRTTDISRSFLDQAGAGWFGAALHGLLRALADPVPEAVSSAVEAMLAIGASSGADTCIGVAACGPLLSGLIPEGIVV